MYINIDLNNEDGHKVYSFEYGGQTFDEEDIARTKCQFMYSRADIPYNVDVSTSDDIKGELCDDIEELYDNVANNYFYKTYRTIVYKTEFVPITYKLYLDPTKYSVVIGRLRFFGCPYVSIGVNNSDSKYDMHELLNALKSEGFTADITTSNCVYINSQDSIELIDDCVVFTATILKRIAKEKVFEAPI